TVDVVIESAYWNPASIRRTSKHLGIVTDASQRFERGADPESIPYALDRSTQLIMELAGGTLLKGMIDVYPKKIREQLVPLRPTRVNVVLGTSLAEKEMVGCLKRLEIKPVAKAGAAIKVRVPSFRVDLKREIDLIEEIARVHGYDRITDKTTSTVDFSRPFQDGSRRDMIRDILIGLGFHEGMSNSMQDSRRVELSGVHAVRIMNPLGAETAFMRTSLVPGLLDSAARNQSFGITDVRLFEVGHVFFAGTVEQKTFVSGIVEEERVGILMMGLTTPRHWSVPGRQMDVFDLKGEIEALVARCALDKCRFISYSTTDTLADNQIRVEINDTYAGYFGRVKKEVREMFGLHHEAYVAELDLLSLDSGGQKKYEPLPRFPRVRRDVAFIVDSTVTAERIEEVMKETGSALLQLVEVFDVYDGENLPVGKKSLAFSLEIMSREKTLTEAEIETEVKRIVKKVEGAFGASLRSS
ncbi:MAG: phenylalanine--tRNA ligase subunit beta, partial [Ignavibacteriae bacterium]|nr:phenylalanine--tRNA ligase subunit beta [Ignavibacteriota bacterium]